MNATLFFRETDIVNGNVVKDIELEKKIDSEKDVIKGYVNGLPIKIVRKHNSQKTNKNGKEKKRKRRTHRKRKSATKK
jgi:RNAse (barnase) inhibitor barstar